jgi:phytoene dehydrogenase-like protein
VFSFARFVVMSLDVVVIGGGVNGLVTATLLARRREVIVLERGERVGRRAALDTAALDPR